MLSNPSQPSYIEALYENAMHAMSLVFLRSHIRCKYIDYINIFHISNLYNYLTPIMLIQFCCSRAEIIQSEALISNIYY